MDSFREFIQHEENESGPNSVFSSALKKVISKTNTSFLIIHHQGKAGEGDRTQMYKARGSSQITAVIRSQIYLKKKDEDKIEIQQPKLNNGRSIEPAEIEVDWGDNDDYMAMKYAGKPEKKEKERPLPEQCAEKIEYYTRNIKETFKRNEVDEYLNQNFEGKFKRSTVTTALKKLKEEKGILNCTGKGEYELIN